MNCDLTPNLDRFIGVDYGQRKIAWTILDDLGIIQGYDEYVLPLDPHDNCHMCQLGMLADVVDGRLTDQWVTPRTLVTVELPIMAANNFVQTKLAMVAGMVIASVSRATDKHLMVPPGSWKLNFTDHGDASKEQVAEEAVQRYPHLVMGQHSQDVFDSLGIARWGLDKWNDEIEEEVS